MSKNHRSGNARAARGETTPPVERKKIVRSSFFGMISDFLCAQKMAEEKDPWRKLFNDLMAFEILENRLKCCKACYCVGIDADGKPFKIIHGDQSLLDVERSDDPKVT